MLGAWVPVEDTVTPGDRWSAANKTRVAPAISFLFSEDYGRIWARADDTWVIVQVEAVLGGVRITDCHQALARGHG